MSDWPLHLQLHFSTCQDDLMWYCSWPPDASTGGYICIFPIASPQTIKLTLCMTVNVMLTLYNTALHHQMPLLGVHLHCILSKYELLNNEQCMLIALCCGCYCFMLLLFICHCASTITDEQQQNYTVTTPTTIATKKINLHKLLNLFVLIICVVTV